MKVSRLFASILTISLLVPSVANATPGKKVGSVHLADRKDRDVVVLPPCSVSKNKRADDISFRVTKYGAEIDHFKVVFQNGEQQVMSVKDHFRVNSSSRWINLKGDNRCIQRIIVKGDTDTRRFRPGKQAKITFFTR